MAISARKSTSGTKPSAAAKPAAKPKAAAKATEVTLTPAEQYAYGLIESAIRLDQANKPGEVGDALDHNLVSWVYLKTAINKDGAGMPDEVKGNLNRLADYVAGISLNGKSLSREQVDSLINLNLQISEGLLEGETRHRIRERAYQLWEQGGRPHGRDQDFWFDAERDILG